MTAKKTKERMIPAIKGEVPLSEFKEMYASVFTQAENRTYLSQGYVTHEVNVAGNKLILRTLRKAERDFIASTAPTNFYTDERVLNKLAKMAKVDDVDYGMILNEFIRTTKVQQKFDNYMLLFGINSIDGEEMFIPYSSDISEASFLEDERVKEKIQTFENYPPIVVEAILNAISELSMAFQVAMEELIENPK